jgi:pyrophosphatase PpaX
MARFKLVIFDLDGTLADTDLVMVQTMIDFIRRYDPNRKVSLLELLRLSGPPITDTLKQYFPNHNNDDLVKEFADVARHMYPKYALAYPGIHTFLNQLRQAQIQVAIVTSKLKRNALITLQEIGLEGAFDYIISLDDVQQPKPHPEGIHKVLKHFGFSTDEAIFIGDSTFDYEAALNAKMAIAMVNWSLKGYPSHIKPTFWISHFEQAWKEIGL